MAGTATWTIEVQDKASGPANAIASALGKIPAAANATKTAAKGADTALGQVGQAASKAGGGIAKAGEAAKSANFETLAAGAKGALGPMGGLFEKTNLLVKGLGSGGVAGVAITAAAALLVMLGAIGAVIYKMASLALTYSDAARSQNLLLEGFIASKEAAGKSTMAVGELSAMIARVSEGVAIGADKITGLAKELYSAGLRGATLEAALKAASVAASAGGDEAAAAFVKAAAAAKATGKSVDDLAAKTTEKFGGIAAKQMLSLSALSMQLGKAVAKIFDGVNIDSFLGVLRDVVHLFDQSTVTGRGLKAAVTGLMDPVFGSVKGNGPIIIAFFKGMVVGVLMCTVAIMTLGKAVRTALVMTGLDGVLAGVSGVKVALWAGVAVIGLVAAAVVVLAGSLAVLAAAFLFVMAAALLPIGVALIVLGAIIAGVAVAALVLALPFLVVAAVLAAVGYAVYLVITHFGDLVGVVTGAGASVAAAMMGMAGDAIGALADFAGAGASAAAGLIAGLVGGISSGTGSVMAAIMALAQGMKGAIKSALGIHSPSTVFGEFGGYTAEGLAGGMDDSSGTVEASAAKLGSKASTGAAGGIGAGAKAGARAGGGGLTLNFAPGAIQIMGVKGAEQLQGRTFIDQLAMAFEEALQEQGVSA